MFASSSPLTLETCPNCKSDDLEELMQCDFCEEWFRSEELEDVEGIVNENLVWACPECMKTYRLEEE